MKLDDRLIVLDDQVFHVELRALWKDPSEFVERARNERLLARVVTRERVSAHHDPVDIVSNVFEEVGAVAGLQAFEDIANDVGRNSRVSFSLRLSG
jgi:uncharacterized protein (DUF2267 family)